MHKRVVELGQVEGSGCIEEYMEWVLRKWEGVLEQVVGESENGRRYLHPRRVEEK